ncbi:MAG: hypothetical protein IPP97_15795 [Candidatus Obscuribacter sp.]|nr:hypothetical protein [Candidatus Obscuribacter sp.]
MKKPLIFIAACLALSMHLNESALAQTKDLVSDNKTGKGHSTSLDDQPGSYGYAGVRLSQDAQGAYFDFVEESSPAYKSGLRKNDRLENFKLRGTHGRIFKSLLETISYNPNQTIDLTIRRDGIEMKIPLRVSSLKKYPNEKLFNDKRKERLHDSKGIPYSPELIADASEMPQIIEFFDSKTGPLSLLLEKRLCGIKVFSLPLDDPRTQTKLRSLGLSLTPQIVSVSAAKEKIFPVTLSDNWRVNRHIFDDIYYEKPEPGEFVPKDHNGPPVGSVVKTELTPDEFALRREKFDGWTPIVYTGLGKFLFDGRGGHLGPSISSLRPVAHTWHYQNQKEFSSSKAQDLSRILHALVLQAVKALNNNTLDFKESAQILSGEAKLTGVSIKAGSVQTPSLGEFKQLSKDQIEVRLLSEKTAVARVHHVQRGGESYFYLIDDNGWKISAIRTPLDGRKIAPGYDIDEPSMDDNWNRIEAERIQKSTPAQKELEKSYHDEQVRALKRSLMTDDEIKVWFSEHRDDLSILAKQGMNDLKVNEYAYHIRLRSIQVTKDPPETLAAKLNALELGTARKLKDKNVYLAFACGRYSLSGLLYSEDNCAPPIGPYGTIWTEKLSDHWYLMRVIDEDQFPGIDAFPASSKAVNKAP